jgi:sec-independent protein translocase protein TatA
VNLDPEKLLMLLTVAMVVIGPQRLPQAARSLGRGLAEVKRYRSLLQSELTSLTGLVDEPHTSVRPVIRGAAARGDVSKAADESSVSPSAPVPEDPSIN